MYISTLSILNDVEDRIPTNFQKLFSPSIAPSAPPEGLRHTQISTKAVVLQWNPPPSGQQNGHIRHYIISVTELDTGLNFSITALMETGYSVGSLHPFYTYNISVSAVTVAAGPYTEPYTIRTQEDSKFLCSFLISVTDFNIPHVFQLPVPHRKAWNLI